MDLIIRLTFKSSQSTVAYIDALYFASIIDHSIVILIFAIIRIWIWGSQAAGVGMEFSMINTSTSIPYWTG